MSTIGSRLKESREKKGLLQSELAKMIGVKSAGVISNWEKDINKPNADKMIEICRVLGISLSYLLDYYGEKTAPLYSGEAMQLAADYDGLDKHGQKIIRLVTDEEKARCAAARSTPAPETPRMVERLIYVNPAAAGTPLYAESDFERMEFPEDKVPAGADFGIRISGRSMEPDINDGDIVWVHKTADFEDGEVGVFMLNDSSTCKRYYKNEDGTVRLESDNPEFGPVPLSEFDSFVPVGRVVGKV